MPSGKHGEGRREESEELVQRRLAELQTIYASVPVGLAFVDKELRFASINEVLADLNGLPIDEHIGRTLGEVLPSELAAQIEPNYRRVIETGEPVTGQELRADTYSLRGVMGDWLVSYHPVKDAEGEVLGVNTLVQEITERNRAEESQRRLTFLAESSELFSSSLDYESTLASVSRLAVPRLADWCAVDMAAEDEEPIRRVAAAHQDPKKVAWAHELQRRYPPDPEQPGGVPNVLRTGRSEFYPKITEEMLEAAARDEAHLELLREIGFTSALIVPMSARGRTLGAITLVSAESGREYEEADLRLAEELARRAALAVDNARLYEEMRGSRDELESILEGVADGVTAQDPTGRVIYANEAAARISGYPTAREMLQAPPQDFLRKFELLDDSGSPFPVERLPGRLSLQGKPSPETLLRFREVATGEERWSMVKASPVFDQEGCVRLAINIFRDVTERKRVEEMRARLGAIVESSDDAIIGKTLEGVITSWNRGAQKLYGYSAEEAVGQHITILVPPELPDEIPAILSKIKRGGVIEHYETVRITKDGERLVISLTISPIKGSAGIIIGASTIARDITERKRAEEALRESEERFRATFEQAAVGIAHVDADGRWLRVNQKLCEIIGYSREELVKKTFQDITHPHDLDADLEQVHQLLSGNTETYSMEKRYIKKDDSIVWINLTVSLVRDPAGEPKYFIAVIEDISERKWAEEAIREVREAERQRIAYDLHDGALQDLTYALVQAQLVQEALENPELNPQLEQTIEALKRTGQELRAAVYDLSLEEEPERSLPEMLNSLVELNRRMVPDRDVRLEVKEGFPSSPLGKRGLGLVRIVQEALTNVRKHSEARKVVVVLEAEEERIWAEVSDDGRGLEPGLSPGIGLSSMRERARALGGDLKIESEPGKGTRVRFEMSLEGDGEGTEPEQQIRILLVEDHTSFREAIISVFERDPGFEVVGQAGSLAEARELLNNRTMVVDVAVVDLGLPDGYGGDLIQELREKNSQAQALVLSASLDKAEVARAVEAGAAGVLHKSVGMEEVVEAVWRLRAGEALLLVEEVIELLRFAGSRREREHEVRRAIAQLTDREKEVLKALTEGLDGKEIAERLCISHKTERNHMANILAKLGVHSRLQALVFTLRYGIVEIE